MSKTFKIAIISASIFALNACGGGGSGSNDTSVALLPDTDTPTVSVGASIVKNQGEAAKFLNRATFGPTQASIDDLVNKRLYENWINEQFNTSPTFHFNKVKTLATQMCANRDGNNELVNDSWEIRFPRHQIWWETAIKGDDQLRQRVALALSEILVVSDSEGLGLNNYQLAVTSYYDVLVKHAFGNYRNLLEEVTLHPAMGDFLSMSRNQKANDEGTIRPDENYARENLQLFTIGVHELNLNGTKKRDSNGAFIPTYDQKTIEEFAKVYTGWSYADKNWKEYAGRADRTIPLIAFEEYHDTSEKVLLNGEISPAGQTAQEDLDFALDNIFKHPNIGPFISKQLIQRLVTSNPTPAYVERVATKFNDNGDGVKGDMKAVISAILLDEEALSDNKPANFGKLREPMLRMSHLWRAFEMQASLRVGHYWEPERLCGQGNYAYYNVSPALPNITNTVGQGPLQARSVFNFFKPDFTPVGILNDNGIVAPEFQIINENTMVSTTNLMHKIVEKRSTSESFVPALGQNSELDMRSITTLAADTDQLLDYLDKVLMNNEMGSSLRNILSEHLNKEDVYADGREGQFQKAREAVMLLISSPEYLIQR